jgi:lambda repressor-like predicted transcriptional regulator
MNTQHARAALTLRGTSLPRLAAKHGANYKTLYATINGDRPGRDDKVRSAMAEIRRLVREVHRG